MNRFQARRVVAKVGRSRELIREAMAILDRHGNPSHQFEAMTLARISDAIAETLRQVERL